MEFVLCVLFLCSTLCFYRDFPRHSRLLMLHADDDEKKIVKFHVFLIKIRNASQRFVTPAAGRGAGSNIHLLFVIAASVICNPLSELVCFVPLTTLSNTVTSRVELGCIAWPLKLCYQIIYVDRSQ